MLESFFSQLEASNPAERHFRASGIFPPDGAGR